MPLPADLFLSLRYLRPKRTFISVITLLSILGPILGVALLIIVTSVMSGFDREIRERILSMQAHLHVYPLPILTDAGSSLALFDEPASVIEAVQSTGARAAPILEGPALIQVQDRVVAKFMRGIDPGQERQVTDIWRHTRGRYEVGYGEALIGEELAFELQVGIGDRLLIHSPSKLTRGLRWDEDGRLDASGLNEVYLPEEVVVVGLFSMGLYEVDSSLIIVNLDQAADVFGVLWGSASSVHASVPDPFRMTALAATVDARLPMSRVVTWQEANQRLFGALRVEKNLMFFLLTFIVLVAAFGISGTLITVVVQKTREIGILKAVGMTSWTVARIFVLQGAIIGVIGTLLGTGFGLLVIRQRNVIAAFLGTVMGVEVFPKELYHLSQIPALVTRRDVGVIVALALLMCVAASLIPALYASCLSPAAALEEEN